MVLLAENCNIGPQKFCRKGENHKGQSWCPEAEELLQQIMQRRKSQGTVLVPRNRRTLATKNAKEKITRNGLGAQRP
jgi:hypothetical protein